MRDYRSEIVWRDLSSIVPYINNTKKHPKDQIAKIAGSIAEFGFDQPIVVDGDQVIIKGHGRYLASQQLQLQQVPVLVRTDLTPAQVKAARIADNRVAQSAWDEDLLRLELSDLKSLDVDLSLTGFDPTELSAFLTDTTAIEDEDEAEFDRAAELRKQYGVKSGQLWQLGPHRLLIGDATKAEDVIRLMQSDKASLVVTDPPYGVSYADKNKFLNAIDKGNRIQTEIQNDHLNKEQTQVLWKSAFHEMAQVMNKGAVVYCFMPQGGDQMMMMMMMMGAGIEPRHELIWLKNNHVLGRTDYSYKHEPILYAWKDGGHKFYGDFQTSILEFPRPQKSDLHPTTKPVELIMKLIENSSLIDQIVYDPFGGSGTTLIACHNTKRICRMLEINLDYGALILYRYVQKTGIEPIVL